MKTILVMLPFVMLVGCEQYYRYPCQNPDNWNKAMCHKPECEINRQCPEHIFGENDMPQDPRLTNPPAAATKCKGDCK